jgi:hypothetical protein
MEIAKRNLADFLPSLLQGTDPFTKTGLSWPTSQNALPINTITLGIKFQHMNLRGTLRSWPCYYILHTALTVFAELGLESRPSCMLVSYTLNPRTVFVNTSEYCIKH